MKWLDGIIDSMDMNLSKLWEILADRGAWYTVVHGVRVGHDLVTEQQQIFYKIILLTYFPIIRELGCYNPGKGRTKLFFLIKVVAGIFSVLERKKS